MVLKLSQLYSKFLHWVVCQISDCSKNNNKVFGVDQFGSYGNFTLFDWDILYPAKKVWFENIELMGHNCPDKYLTYCYGDYMTPPPEDKRGGHLVGIIDLDKNFTEYLNNNTIKVI